MRRWIVRAILTLAVLLVMGFIAVQLVLRSDLPRRTVLERLSAQTGLHWSASSLHVPWSGTSTLRDVAISLPLEDQPLFTAPLVEAVHPSLIALLFGAPLDLQSVTLRQGHAVLRRNDRGEWNFARAVSMIEQRQRLRGGSAGDARATPPMPALQISGIAVDVERDGAVSPIGELQCDGTRHMARYEFKASLGTANRISGMLVAGDTWAHEITFELQQLGTLLHVFDESAPQQLAATGAWAGAVSNGTLAGRLQLTSLDAPLDAPVGTVHASGTMQVDASADGAIIELDNVEFRIPALPDALHVSSGTLQADAGSIEARGVVLRSGAIGAELEGSWDAARRATALDARWRANTHVGTVKASFTQPLIGEPHGSARFETSGSIAENSWRAHGEASVRGSDVESLTGDLRLSALTGTVAGREFDLSGIALSAARDGERIALTRVLVPGADVTAHGEWNTANSEWNLVADIEQFKQPWLSEKPASIEIRASGRGATATLERFALASPELRVEASAEYAAGEDATQITAPLTADISVTIASVAETMKALSLPSGSGPPRTITALDTKELSGGVTVASHVTGSLDPMQLQMRGTIRAKELRLNEHAVASTEIPFESIVGSKELQFTTSRASLFGGSFLTRGRLAPADGLQMHVELDRVRLDAVVAPVHTDVQSLGTVSGDLDIEIPAFRMEELTLSGEWSARGIKTRYSDIDAAKGRVRSADGVVELSDVRLQHLDGSATGSFRYDSGKVEIHAAVDLDDWPVRRDAVPSEAGASNDSGLRARISGGGSVRFHPKAKTAQGSADFSTTLLNGDEEIVTGAVRGTFDGDAVQFELANAAAFGGTIKGRGTIPFAKLMSSEGTFTFENLQLDRISQYWPDIVGFEGSIDGQATLASVTDPQAPGPMRIDLHVAPRDAAFHSAVLGPSDFRIYAARDHVTLEHSQISLADGTVTVWSKLTEHASDYLVRVHASFDRIDLDQLIESVNPGSEPVPGRLAGQIAAGGYLAAPHRMYGRSKVHVSESDLGNIGAVSLIYGALHLGGAGATPMGAGDAEISLEGNALVLRRLTYFNRGTDLIANLVIDDMWAGRTSTMRGAAAGVARPLKDINLPFFDDLDRAVKALQTSSVVVRISGTVENRELKIVPFADVAGTLLSNP